MTPLATRTAALLIMAIFALQPMAFGAWLATIPYIKVSLGLGKADLAIALLAMPLALVPALQVASRVVTRVGPRKTFAAMLPVQTAIVLLPFLATGVPTLFVALALFGTCVAFMEVALNTYSGRLEKTANVMIMSRCHGFWALGVMLGSFLVTAFFAIGPALAVFLVCAVSAALGIWAGLSLPKLAGSQEGRVIKGQKLRDMPRALFFISLFVLAVTLAEGAMADWAAVYLAERWGAGPEDAGIAVTVFAGFLAAGRFAGDWLRRLLGARGVARFTLSIALVGVVFLTMLPGVAFTFLGFAFIGLGVSIGFPLGVSAVAALDDENEAQNIATMTMIAMGGVLMGPPVIGFLAEAFSLRVALMCLFPSLILALWLTRHFPGNRLEASRSDSQQKRTQYRPDSG